VRQRYPGALTVGARLSRFPGVRVPITFVRPGQRVPVAGPAKGPAVARGGVGHKPKAAVDLARLAGLCTGPRVICEGSCTTTVRRRRFPRTLSCFAAGAPHRVGVGSRSWSSTREQAGTVTGAHRTAASCRDLLRTPERTLFVGPDGNERSMIWSRYFGEAVTGHWPLHGPFPVHTFEMRVDELLALGCLAAGLRSGMRFEGRVR